MLFFNIYFLFPMRFCTEIRDERIFWSQNAEGCSKTMHRMSLPSLRPLLGRIIRSTTYTPRKDSTA